MILQQIQTMIFSLKKGMVKNYDNDFNNCDTGILGMPLHFPSALNNPEHDLR